jgi:hypothetical protein
VGLSDDVKKAALEAVEKLKLKMGWETLPVKTESLPEIETGSPRSPGFDEHQLGRTMKSAPQWPQAREAEPANPADPAHDLDDDLDR